MTVFKNRLTDVFVRSYLASLDCPRSLTVWLLYKNKEHRQLCELGVNPLHYNSARSFRDAYLASQFLSKSTFLKTGFDLKAVAIEKFNEAENACRQINQRGFDIMTNYRHGMESLFFAMISKIRLILGDFDGEEWFEQSDWGPGVTLKIKRDTSDVNKYRLETDITTDLARLIHPLIQDGYPMWGKIHSKEGINLVSGNNVTTVPKNAKTDRTIAIEPGINLYFQKGLGRMIRRRLQRFGIDLNDQGRNQRLSKLASKTNHLATVDFSSASDTIAKSLVKAILPDRWYLALNSSRSVRGCIDKREFEYEKFSSMGNGFTFELESLIFFSAAWAICDSLSLDWKQVSVYGDDVIIPKDAYDAFLEFSKYLGFTINQKKSFVDSPFRESCGDHWYLGTDCKPYYLKEVIRDVQGLYKAANSTRRIAYRGLGFGCDIRFLQTWKLLYRNVAHPCYISEGYGDGGFIVNFDEACPRKAAHGIEGFYGTSLVFKEKTYHCDDDALLLARLRRRSNDMLLGNSVPLKGRGKYVKRRILIHRWFDMGPWW